MKTVALGELIQPAKVLRAGSGKYPILSMTMHAGLVDQASKFKKRVASEDISGYKVIRRGQLVVGFPIDEGVLDFQMLYDEGIVSPAYAVWDLTDPARVHAPFLKKYLTSAQSLAYYKGKLRGSTARRRSLPDEVFLELAVPLPSPEQQRRIAAILDHTDALRAKRLQVLAHLDALSQSIFQDMFASGVAGADRIELQGMASLITKGTTPTSVGLQFTHVGVPFVRVQNLQQGTIQFGREDLFISAVAHQALRRSIIGPQDLLISIAGTIGRVAIVPRESPEMNCNQAVAIIRLTEPKCGPWLMAWLNSDDAKRQIGSSSVTATISNLSLSQIRRLSVPLVDAEKIRRFTELSEFAKFRRNAVVAAQSANGELFATLQARAFRGEL